MAAWQALSPSHTNPLNFPNFQTTIKSHAYATAISKLATLLISSCFFHFWQPVCNITYSYDWHGHVTYPARGTNLLANGESKSPIFLEARGLLRVAIMNAERTLGTRLALLLI